MAQDIDFSGTPTKSDREDMKRRARANDSALQDAYESGKEEVAPDRSSSGATVRLPAGNRLSFSNDAQKVIVITMTITVMVALIENLHNGPSLASPTAPGRAGITSGTTQAEVKANGVSNASIIVGGFVSGALLLGMSYFLPEFASGLSMVAMLATVLDRGKPFWDIIGVTSKNIPAISTHQSDVVPATVPNLSPVPTNPNGPNLSPVPQSTVTNPAVRA